ncbi:hypothetical protein BO99DRAFT_428577 [Aspergillus violaceofuscus CBS 115571]|uniref:Uncharacterized protein n=1 Tax=Aspergillus violaceofuscus (strain CBS 115571) TaxID=1450538 RepID=A0A2V5HQ84_ASPV1|nr:hypothetical protein BO99DRAFT_428577 [Aspergillus violaceofuscus CBS 115571]
MQRIFLSLPADWRLGPSAYRYTIIGPDPLTTLLLASALRPARTDPERPDSDQLDGRLSRAMFPPPQLRANWNPPGVDYADLLLTDR